MMDPVWLFEGRRLVPTLLLDSPASLTRDRCCSLDAGKFNAHCVVESKSKAQYTMSMDTGVKKMTKSK